MAKNKSHFETKDHYLVTPDEKKRIRRTLFKLLVSLTG